MNTLSWRHYATRLILLGIIFTAIMYVCMSVVSPLKAPLHSRTMSIEKSGTSISAAELERRIIVYS